MGMDPDPIRVRGLIQIESKLRSSDRSAERPGSGARRDLLNFIGGQIKGLFSVDILRVYTFPPFYMT